MASGYSAFDGQRLLVSNLLNGVDQYSFPTMEHIGNFPHAIATNIILQVAMIPRLAVVGGDDGFVRVFDIGSGAFLFSLAHGNGTTLLNHFARLLLINLLSVQLAIGCKP